MTPFRPLAEGRRFGRYQIEEFLGLSGGAQVYRAHQVNLGRPVTLTILPPEEAARPALRTRFERQIAAASKLRHPNIVSALDAGSVAGHLYIASEHVVGRRLSELLEGGEWIGVRRAVTIALGVARALVHVDGAGLLHRNLNPQSILIGEDGAPKLRGFSFSRPHRQSSKETWFEPDPYSALYTAPDALRQEPLDVRADVYSLGCVLFHMLAGRPPFPATSPAAALEAHAKEPLPDVHALRADLPPALGHVLAKALEKERDRRYPNAEALVADLEAAQAGRPVEPPASQGSGLRSFLRRRGR